MRYMLCKKATLALGLVFLCCTAQSNFLSSPSVVWKTRLPGAGDISGPGLRKDNAVVVSKDGSRIFVTTDDGNLHILRSNDGESATDRYKPQAVPGAYTEGRGGVALSEVGALLYAVYAVIDTPILVTVPYDEQTQLSQIGLTTKINSRLIAVNPDGSLRWTVDLDGYVAGTPVVGHDGDKVYVSHNVLYTGTNDTAPSYRGSLTVVSDNGGDPLVLATRRVANRYAPFGPLTGRTLKADKNSTTTSSRDILFWSESRDDGYGKDGQVYSLIQQRNNDTFQLNVISQWNRSSVTRPAVSTNSSLFWIAGGASALAGWVGNSSAGNSSSLPTWEQKLEPTERNESQPILSAPVVSADDDYLIVAGASFDLSCLESKTGNKVWSDLNGKSVVMSEPRLSEINGQRSVVYTIEALTGRVRQHDLLNGQRNWESDCQATSGTQLCQDSVEAEFSVSDSGNHLYYGDVFGRIVALQVATFQTSAPSEVPSMAPSIQVTIPTVMPSSLTSPTLAPGTEEDTSTNTKTLAPSSGEATNGIPTSPTSANSAESPSSSDEKKNKAATVSVALIGFLVLAVLLFLIANWYRRKREINERQGIDKADSERWIEKQLEYEKECKLAEEATLTEIVGSNPSSPLRKKSRKKKCLPATPSTLESIEEAPDDESFSPSEDGGIGAMSHSSNREIQFFAVNMPSNVVQESYFRDERKSQDVQSGGSALSLYINNSQPGGAISPENSHQAQSLGSTSRFILNDRRSQERGVAPMNLNLSRLSRPPSPESIDGGSQGSERAFERPSPVIMDRDRIGDIDKPLSLNREASDGSSVYIEDSNSVASSVYIDDAASIGSSSVYVEDNAAKSPEQLARPKAIYQSDSREVAVRNGTLSQQVNQEQNSIVTTWLARHENSSFRTESQALPRQSGYAIPAQYANAPPKSLLNKYNGPQNENGKKLSQQEQLLNRNFNPTTTPVPTRALDPWNSFVTTLAKAEQNFFNPRLAPSRPRAVSSRDCPDDESDDEDIPPPPPPRRQLT